MDTSTAALIDALEAAASEMGKAESKSAPAASPPLLRQRERGPGGEGQPASDQPAAQIQEAGSTSVLSSAVPTSDAPPKTEARRCAGTTKAGKPCRTYARIGRDFCYAHDAESRNDFLASSAAAGVASGDARRTPFQIQGAWLFNSAGIQTALDALFRLELTGQLPNNRVRNLVRILAIASRSVSQTESADPEEMRDYIDSLDEALPAALEAQHRADRYHARDAVEDQVMERGQLAVDLERWPQLDRRPVSSRRFDDQRLGNYRSASDHPDFR